MYKELLDEGVLDEIDAVRRAFEATYQDERSDRLWEMIELATEPVLSTEKEQQLKFLFLGELRDRPSIENYLGYHGLTDVYKDILEQVQQCRPVLCPEQP